MLVYSKVRAAIGVQKAVISGGGSLAPHLDTFYEAIGLPVLNGWGLSVRPPHYFNFCELILSGHFEKVRIVPCVLPKWSSCC